MVDERGLLDDVSADLVQQERHEGILRKLFARQSGQWQPLEELCRGHAAAIALIAKLGDISGSVMVTWLDYPDSANGDGFAVVVFFEESLLWHTIALCNRGRLERASLRGGVEATETSSSGTSGPEN
jgi:hypothetical protein